MAKEEVYRNRKIQRLVRFSKEENDYLKDKIERSPFNNFQTSQQNHNYNPHSANNGLTPNQKEENYFKKI